jgi:redox-sensitive bicupin YhaK (pirin superfamily)
VRDVVIEPEYLDVSLPAGARMSHPTAPGHTVFAYVFEGNARFGGQRGAVVEHEHLVLFDDGDRVEASAEGSAARFLLISGRPVREPVAWQGPIVMNTQEELRRAFEEYQDGTFIKKRLSLH